jgi:endonuclease/exonuclease/phosphatase family metal-dependent hydrolase
MVVEYPDECIEASQIAEMIRRELRPLFPILAQCRSSAELERLRVFREKREMVEEVLATVQRGSFTREAWPARDRYRVVAWNIERGKRLEGQIQFLREHPYLKDADVFLLTETDLGMARSGNVDVARRMAEALEMEYAFVPCYLSLVKGSGIERLVEGENELGLHGNAILSRYPVRNPRPIRLRNGIDKMAGKEKRLGSQRALAATVEFPGFPITVVCIHLDANSTQRHRAGQMRDVLDAVPVRGPLLLGGDWNTTTFNSSTAFHAIMGYFLRVLMGPGNVIRNHYLHPNRWFERHLFRLLEERGLEYASCNVLGEHTIFYHVDDVRAHEGLAEWVPGWCFPFIRWALQGHNGGCPLKIDWFAARGLSCQNPQVVHEVRERRREPLSDHDAIGVDIVVE